MTVKILKIGVSNIGSLANMLDYLDVEFDICINAKELKSASKIIMPGVGSFDAAMLSIKETGVDEELKEISAKFQTPILGICLGMQLLLGSSDEGLMSGLKLIDGQCKKFEPSSDFKVPHMSWNSVKQISDSKLLEGLTNPRFYFVHSYYAVPKNRDNVLLTSTYGIEFAAAIKKDNLVGVQFHPEKSHKFGATLIKNFLEEK